MSEENQKLRNSFIQALFYPAAELLGEELRKKLETIIQERHEKREKEHRENLLKHVNAVIERNMEENKGKELLETSNDQETKVMQLRLIPEWVDGSQKVDPENDEQKVLGRLWQDLLFGITSGYNYEDSLIEILSKLRENEARLLLKLKGKSIFFVKTSEYKEKTYFEELSLFDLVKTPSYRKLLSSGTFIKNIIFVTFLALISSLVVSGPLIATSLNVGLPTAAVLFLAIVVSQTKKIRKSAWEITEKGTQLLAYCPLTKC